MKRNAGFSLIETLFALLLLGVGLAGLVEGVVLSLRSSKETEYHSSAVLLAAGRIETLRADGWLVSGETQGDFGEAFPLYSWSERISETEIEGLYDVVVQVKLEASDKVIYELSTRLFEMPLDSAYSSEWETESENARDRRGGRESGRRRRY